MAEAVQHILATGDWDEAGCVIERAAMEAVRNGQLTIIYSWLNALPETVVEENLTLVIFKGWGSLMMGEIEKAGNYVEIGEGLLAADAPPESQIPLKALHSSLALTRLDIPNAIALSERTLELIGEGDDHFTRGIVLHNLAQAQMVEAFLADLGQAVQKARSWSLHKTANSLLLGAAQAAARLLPEHVMSRLTGRISSLISGEGPSPHGRSAALYGMMGTLPNRGDLSELVLDLVEGFTEPQD